MSMAHPSLRVRVDGLPTEGGPRVDAIRLARIEALDRRAAMHTGELRKLLDARLAELLAPLTEEGARQADRELAAARPRPQSPLRSLVQMLDRSGATRDAMQVDPSRGGFAEAGAEGGHTRPLGGEAGNVAADAGLGSPRAPARDGYSAFEDIRQACAEVRTRSQLRQALAAAPADAGPLNSASLVHRALSRMQALSPEYLRHFLAYVDAVSALQPLCSGAVKPVESGSRGAAPGKRSRARSRNPKE